MASGKLLNFKVAGNIDKQTIGIETMDGVQLFFEVLGNIKQSGDDKQKTAFKNFLKSLKTVVMERGFKTMIEQIHDDYTVIIDLAMKSAAVFLDLGDSLNALIADPSSETYLPEVVRARSFMGFSNIKERVNYPHVNVVLELFMCAHLLNVISKLRGVDPARVLQFLPPGWFNDYDELVFFITDHRHKRARTASAVVVRSLFSAAPPVPRPDGDSTYVIKMPAYGVDMTYTARDFIEYGLMVYPDNEINLWPRPLETANVVTIFEKDTGKPFAYTEVARSDNSKLHALINSIALGCHPKMVTQMLTNTETAYYKHSLYTFEMPGDSLKEILQSTDLDFGRALQALVVDFFVDFEKANFVHHSVTLEKVRIKNIGPNQLITLIDARTLWWGGREYWKFSNSGDRVGDTYIPYGYDFDRKEVIDIDRTYYTHRLFESSRPERYLKAPRCFDFLSLVFELIFIDVPPSQIKRAINRYQQAMRVNLNDYAVLRPFDRVKFYFQDPATLKDEMYLFYVNSGIYSTRVEYLIGVAVIPKKYWHLFGK